MTATVHICETARVRKSDRDSERVRVRVCACVCVCVGERECVCMPSRACAPPPPPIYNAADSIYSVHILQKNAHHDRSQ